MLVNYKNRKLLLPFDPMYYCWWVKKYNAKMKFYGIAVPAPDASRRNSLMICAACGTHAGLYYHYADGITCSKCGNSYHNNRYAKEYNARILNCLIGLPRVRDGKVSFDLYEYAENAKTGVWEPELFYTIRYSKESGLETIPAPGKRSRPIHHLTSTRMQVDEGHVQKLIKAFEKVHSGNGFRDMLYDKRREKGRLDIKVLIQYFYYLGKYPQLEQIVKAGYMPAFTVYINTHGEVYKYLINNAPFTSYLKLVKIDSETGRQIPYAGAAFQIYDANGQRVVMQYTYPALTEADTFYTSADGYLITPEKLNQGCYQLVEVQAPYGYVLHDEPVRFKVDDDEAVYEDGLTLIVVDFPNEPQKGAIHIKKTGEVFSSVQTNGETYLPVYSIQGLAGATFKIIADEDIITPDGTVRAKKGDVVDTITTSATGEAQSKALYLGRYRVVEVQCPYGMLLSGEQTVELVYAGQYVELADVSASFYNERQKVQINFEKVIETDETFNVGGDRTVTFGLFAAEEIKASDGSVIPVDGLIEIIQFSTSGAGTFTADIPFGAFYVKELQSAGSEYLPNNTKYPVVFEYQGQDIATVEIKVNDGNPILNELIYGSVKGFKVDESNAPVAGAVIGLFCPDETEFTRENAFMVDISSASGEFSFENVVYGHWVIAEIEQPEGFILTLEVYHVYIDSDGMAIDIVIENERIKGNVLLAKLDEDYPENKLTGAVFDVYEDANGNGKFDEEDVFVNALEETETGIYELNDLICGNYLIVESAAPEGFEKDENVYFFEIRTNGETVMVENEAGVGFLNKAQLGNLVISKSSEDGIIEGFEFVVEGVDFLGNKYSETFETDAEGKISVSIRPGAYEVFEKDAPDNVRYVMPDGQTVEITANEESALVFANVLKKGSIEFRKVDKSTGKPLAGVSFAIYNADENMIAEGKTDSNGILRFDGIIYGNYLWQETATVDGYIAQPGFHKFSVTEHGQLITVTAENEPIPDVPKTGDNSSLPMWFGLLALSGGSLAGLLFFDRKIKTSLKG